MCAGVHTKFMFFYFIKGKDLYIYIYVYFDKEGLFIYYCESDDSYEVQVKPPSITEIWLISIIFTLEVLYYLS